MVNNLRIMWPLLLRDFKVMADGLWDDCINGLLVLTFAYINFAVFGSNFGIDQQFAAQAVIGIIVTISISMGFGRAFTDLLDREETGFMAYRRTLMISTSWLLVTFVMSYAAHIACVTLPAILVACMAFSKVLTITPLSIFSFGVIWLGGILFLSAFSVNLVCFVSFTWFRFNVWQRLLTPMALTGCVLYSWGRLHAFSPFLSRCALCNPITYFTEGLRVSLHESVNSLPAWVCAIMIWMFFGMALLLLVTEGRKRLEND